MRILSPLSVNWSQPYGQVSNVLDELDSVFDTLLRPKNHLDAPQKISPQYDIKESNSQFTITCDMPGVKKDDIKVTLKDRHLLIVGERRSHTSNETSDQKDTSLSRFEREFVVPNSVNAENIEAKYEDGVLSLVLVKTPKVEAKTIPVQSGSDGVFSKPVGASTQESETHKESKVS